MESKLESKVQCLDAETRLKEEREQQIQSLLEESKKKEEQIQQVTVQLSALVSEVAQKRAEVTNLSQNIENDKTIIREMEKQ